MSAENTSAPRRDDEEATDEPPNAFMDALHAYANALDALDLAKDSLANARIAAETAATAGSLSIGQEFATDLIALCRSCHGLFHAQGKLAS